MRVRVRLVDTVPVPVGIGSDAPANNVSQTKSSILRVAPLTIRFLSDRYLTAMCGYYHGVRPAPGCLGGRARHLLRPNSHVLSADANKTT